MIGSVQHESAAASNVSPTAGVKAYQALATIVVKAPVGSCCSPGSTVAELRSTGPLKGRFEIVVASAKLSFAGGGTAWMCSCIWIEPKKTLPSWTEWVAPAWALNWTGCEPAPQPTKFRPPKPPAEDCQTLKSTPPSLPPTSTVIDCVLGRVSEYQAV